MDIYAILQILIATIAATSAMTLFSYAVSASFRELYKEPVLLTFLLKQLKINVSNKGKATLAWLLHYFIGFIFVYTYHLFMGESHFKFILTECISIRKHMRNYWNCRLDDTI
ncbi:hypothetical protein [Flavobacterium flavigenum]|uniref:hypothetical protein n=1 Tax=Flavobacterium flavigenum TaxID=3003258 RepID=UPI002482DD77|nr:hypothetical protein [Flavobacterium flavigenum]